jgi:hypothetical protein
VSPRSPPNATAPTPWSTGPRRLVAGPHGHTGSVERSAIEADRDQYSELVAGLEADNARLTRQLRALQWRA